MTAVQVQRNINTELRKMLVLSDNSPTGKALIRQIREELQQNPLDIEFEYRITDSWEEYQQFITEANASDINSLYPVALRLIDRQGKPTPVTKFCNGQQNTAVSHQFRLTSHLYS